MNYDRVHARKPSHRVDRWSAGVIESIGERGGHAVLTVRPVGSEEGDGGNEAAEGDDAPIELVVTVAVRDLFVGRLPIDDDESAVGQRVWYRKRGG